MLQEREFERVGGTRTIKVDVRLVCATNRNLEEMVARGDFRADLYYRINVVPVFIPSLRERKEDIPLLALHFLDAFNRENERSLRFSENALAVLAGCTFPGNVRELENCVHRVATMAKGEVLDEIDVPCQTNRCRTMLLTPQPAFAGASGNGASNFEEAPAGCGGGGCLASHSPAPPVPAPMLDDGDDIADWRAIDDLGDLDALPQRERLIRVMEKAGWVQAKAARLLGLTPRQIGYALRKYNIEIKRL